MEMNLEPLHIVLERIRKMMAEAKGVENSLTPLSDADYELALTPSPKDIRAALERGAEVYRKLGVY